MDNKIVIFSDGELSNKINGLITESSKVKRILFNSFIMKKDIDVSELNEFKDYVENFLKEWSEYSIELKNVIKTIKTDECNKESITLKYDFVKDFIYGNYDYASVLQFTDGVMKGLKSGDMSRPFDFENFKDHTISMAFNNLPPSVASLIDSVSSDEISLVMDKIDDLSLKNFDSIKTYNNLFPYNDKSELTKSIFKVIDYLSTGNNSPDNINYESSRLYISLINNIVEYITYSLAVYVVRIFVISKYAEPFIFCKHDNEEITESVGNEFNLSKLSENPNGEISSILHNLEELTIKDMNEKNKLRETVNNFLKLIGVSLPYDDKNESEPYNISKKFEKEIKNNKLYNKLKNNILYDFLIYARYSNLRSNKAEFNQKIKSIMYNQYQGLQEIATPKNEFLNIIKEYECDSTIEGYKGMARDISMMVFDIIERIDSLYIDMQYHLDDINNNLDNTYHIKSLGYKKSCIEFVEFLENLYEELVFLFIQKAKYIEKKINALRSNEVKKTIDIVSLDIPGLTSDLSIDHSMMLSVPTTTRCIVEYVDMYGLPIYESYEMYNEYLQSLPEFSNDLYFKEVSDEPPADKPPLREKLAAGATNALSNIISKLKTILESLWKRIQNFWNGKAFDQVKKWVINNEETLRNMKFSSNAKLDALPYKDSITLPKGFSNLTKNLKNFDEKSIENSDALQQYLKSLYPSDTVSQWFIDDSSGKVAAQRYMNLILFDDGSDAPKNLINISGDTISEKVKVWVDTIKASDQILDSFKKINDDISNSVGSINSKMVSITNKYKSQSTQYNTNSASNNASQTNNDKLDVNTNSDKLATLADAGNRITVTITRLWSPIAPIIIRAMINQYNYIKTAYSLRDQSDNTNKSNTNQTTGQL